MQLQGVRVVDLTRILSGPFCSLLLADMGAEVIKVEPPGGDPLRGQGAIVEGLSWYFAAFNRNKRSVLLNLRRASGRAALRRLVATADVVVDDFRPGVMAALGLDWSELSRLRPALIHTSVSGFGAHGPYADRPSFDFIAQAMSGFMSGNGTPETGPMRAGAPISDLVAGVYAKLLSALDLGALHDHADFRTNDLRVQHRAAINGLINARIAQAPKAYWLERLNAAGVPCGVVMNLAEVFADPQVVSQEMVLAIPHPGHGTVTMTGFPLKFREAPCTVRYPAPEFGAHTAGVLRALGYSDPEVAELSAESSTSA